MMTTALYEFDNFCIFYCINNTFGYIFTRNKVTELCFELFNFNSRIS